MKTSCERLLRLADPAIPFQEVAEPLRQVLESGWLTCGPWTERFEKGIAGLVGTREAVATSSGTTALHLGLRACGVGPGDEVLLPAYTFPATAHAVIHCGARPVLVDVDPENFNIDPHHIPEKVSPHMRVILVVHQFGKMAPMEAILDLARRFELQVVEDAACALGSVRSGRAAGSLGRVACFSFHPRKILTTGEGGMVTTNDEEAARCCRLLRNHGQDFSQGERVFRSPGFNYRMDEVSALLGCWQLPLLEQRIRRRRELARALSHALSPVPWLRTPPWEEAPDHVFQSYVVVLDRRVDRANLIRFLRQRGIEAAPAGVALHLQPYFQRDFPQRTCFPVAERLHRQALALPLHHSMNSEDVDRISESLRAYIPEDRP